MIVKYGSAVSWIFLSNRVYAFTPTIYIGAWWIYLPFALTRPFFIQAKQTLHEDSSASLERGELSETSQAGGYDVGKTFLSNHLPIRAICVPISCQRGTTTCTVPSRKKTGC